MPEEEVSTGELYRILQRIERNMVSKDANDEVIRSLREDHRIDVQALSDLRAEFSAYKTDMEAVKRSRFNGIGAAALSLAVALILKFFVPDVT